MIIYTYVATVLHLLVVRDIRLCLKCVLCFIQREKIALRVRYISVVHLFVLFFFSFIIALSKAAYLYLHRAQIILLYAARQVYRAHCTALMRCRAQHSGHTCCVLRRQDHGNDGPQGWALCVRLFECTSIHICSAFNSDEQALCWIGPSRATYTRTYSYIHTFIILYKKWVYLNNTRFLEQAQIIQPAHTHTHNTGRSFCGALYEYIQNAEHHICIYAFEEPSFFISAIKTKLWCYCVCARAVTRRRVVWGWIWIWKKVRCKVCGQWNGHDEEKKNTHTFSRLGIYTMFCYVMCACVCTCKAALKLGNKLTNRCLVTIGGKNCVFEN